MAVFKDFMVTFNRSYGNPKELQRRYRIFQQNMQAAQWLQDTDEGTAQYGVTQFSDLTDEEFLGLGHFSNAQPAQPVWKKVNVTLAVKPQKSCDWRKDKKVSAVTVKNQGSVCSACWAFASASNIESVWVLAGGDPRKVSVQELIDCAECKRDGCHGGWVWDAFMTVLRRSGLSSEHEYPYAESKNECKNRTDDAVAWITDFAMLEKNEISMADYVAIKGPITVTINQILLQNYQSGIVKPRTSQDECSPDNVNHSVLLIGYGVEKKGNVPYWILQNSWGQEWGEKGYFRLHRGSNMCGITKYPVTALLGSSKVPPCPPAHLWDEESELQNYQK